MWSRLAAALGRVLGGGAKDDDLSAELRAFVEPDAESKIRSGMTPEDARRAALIDLGGVEQVKERVREDRAGARWESVVRDIRYAMRGLGRARGFSSSVLANLSLGLAATIVAFAFISGALLRPCPGVRDQDRLVTFVILEGTPLVPRVATTALADYPDVFRALGEGMTSLEDLASVTESDVAVTLPQSRSLPAAFVSPNYFDVLGVRPEVGRTFVRSDGQAGAAVAVIGHDLWTREFARDPSVAGRPLQVGAQTFQLIGVASPGFRGTSQGPVQTGVDLWLPIALADRVGDPLSFGRGGLVWADERPGARVIRYVGRMRDGVRADRVEAELAVLARQVAAPAGGRATPMIAEVSGLSRLNDLRDPGQLVAIILSVPLLVLAIACINAANLFLVRASQRRREVAVRLALGASRLRLVGQLVIESLALAIGAAVLALPLAILELGTLDQTIRADILQQRMLARGAAVLGIVALLLASVGLYGVTSLASRCGGGKSPFGWLSVRPDRVLRMVVRHALVLAAIGSVLGGVAAIAVGLLIQAEVFGVARVDIAALGGSAALLTTAMLLASILPALRAARMDPMAVLREEEL